MRGWRPVPARFCVVIGVMAAASALAAPVSRPPGARNCIDGRTMSAQGAEDTRTIVFSDGMRTYRNHLRTECPGAMQLNSFGSLETEPQGTQLCDGDTVRVFDPYGVRTVGILAYPRCVLGWFEPVPKAAKPPKPPKH